MTTATSAVDICNLALDQIKYSEVITSITTPIGEVAGLCARWYDVTRRAALRRAVWNFAKKRKVISRDSVDPAFGYSDAYNLPNDFIRLLFLGDDTTKALKTAFQIEGVQVFINASGAASLNLGYIYDQTNVVQFDALFVEVLVLMLAEKLARKLVGKQTMLRDIKESLDIVLRSAKSIDGQERPPSRIQRSKFVQVRRRRTSNVAGPTTYFNT